MGTRAGVLGGPSEFTRAIYLSSREVVLVSARHGKEEALWPVDWHMPAGLEPPRYALSIAAGGHGTAVLLAASAFVVNFVAATHEAVVLEAGARSGREGNKREALGLEARDAAFIGAPVLAIAEGWLECRVEESRLLGDRQLVLGRVVHAETAIRTPRLHHSWVPR